MGAIDTTANRIATTYDSQGNTPSTTGSSSAGATGSTGGAGSTGEAGDIEQGYEQFAQEQNGSTQFDQKTWDSYKQQLGDKVGQDGGSLSAGAVEAAEAAAETKSKGDTSSQHLLPAGTQLKFEDGSQYTVKPGDTISYESLQQYMPKTQTQTNEGSPDHGQGFKAVTDSTNPLSPANNDVAAGPDGKKPSHKDYYANLNSPDNPNNPYGLYNAQDMGKLMAGATGSSGSSGGEEEQKAGALQGKS